MIRTPGRRLPLLFVLAMVTSAGAAAARQQPPRFTAGIELVHLDVEVTDAEGRPIDDLRPEEFEIVEDGVRRPVVFLQHVREPVGSYADAAQRTIGGDVSTNQGAPRGRLYVFVFDQSHITPSNEQLARRAAERFLRARMRPGDRVALFALPGPGATLGFTGDVARVIDALTNIGGTREAATRSSIGEMQTFEAFEIDRANQEVLQRVLLRITAEFGGRGGITEMDVRDSARSIVNRADFRARQFLETFTDLLRELQRFEGRKDVILLSEGFHADNLVRDLERVVAAAAQSYSAVYALDINRNESNLRELAPLGAQRFSAIQSRVSPLGTLAEETDGLLFTYASRRLDEVLERIAGTSVDHYIVGFEPADRESEDSERYRRVTVQVARRGVRVSTRTGYAVSNHPTPADRRQAINAALTAPFALQGLRVEYTTYVFRGDTPDASRVVMSLEADLPVAAARSRDPAEVVFVVRDARSGQAVASGTDIIALPAALTPGASTGRGTYRVQFEAPPGAYLMRAVVREPGGQIGSADRRFDIRPNGPGVSASDLMLGPSTDRFPMRAAAFTEEGLHGLIELYGTPEELEEVDLELRLVSSGETGTATSIGGDLLEITGVGDRASRAARFELPIEELPAGRYAAEVDVRRSGETIGQLRRELDIVVGSRPVREPDPAGAVDVSQILRGELASRYLAALDPLTDDERLTEALALARLDDWAAVDGLVAAPGPDSTLVELVLRGLARFAEADHAGAAAALESAFAADTETPRQALTGFFLGWAYAYDGDDREAASAWRRAVFLDAELVPAYLALADAYARQSQPALAVQVLETGLTALPDSLALRDRLSRLTP